MSYLEYEACVACGLDLWMWESCEYPHWFKARVVGYHNMSKLVKMHSEDALSEKMKQKERRG